MLSTMTCLLAASVSVQTHHSDKQSEYLNLAAATLGDPVTHEQLEQAVLSPDGAATIQKVFERSLEQSLIIGASVVTPELGGESTLTDDGRLRLIVYPDPIHPVVRELARGRDHPETLLRMLGSSAEGRFLLKSTGGLHALLYQMTASPTDAQRELLDRVIEQTVAQHFKTWTTDPIIQAEMIEQTEWTGRYTGFWHIHPPRLRAGGEATEGIEPSMADMRNAIDLGQFLTIVFQPDGFDVYDLSPLAREAREDLSKAKRIRYRSETWRRDFEQAFRIAQGSSVP